MLLLQSWRESARGGASVLMSKIPEVLSWSIKSCDMGVVTIIRKLILKIIVNAT